MAKHSGIEPQFFADWLKGTGLDQRYWNKLLRREKFKADELMERGTKKLQ